MQYSASPSVSTPLFSPCLDRCHCRIFMFCKKWAQTQPLADSLTASFLTSVHSLSTLSHHLLHPKFPSLDFPPRVRYFWFKHFFVRPAGQSHNCYQVFNFLTQQISSTHYAHTSARSVKKFLIMFPESLEKAYHKSTIHKKLIMNLFCVLLWCQMHLLQNFILSSASGTQFFVQPRIVSVLRHVHHQIPICPQFASKYELPSVYPTSPLDIKEEKRLNKNKYHFMWYMLTLNKPTLYNEGNKTSISTWEQKKTRRIKWVILSFCSYEGMRKWESYC